MKQNKLIPQLRFPEFAKNAEWEVKTLGEVSKSFSGGTPSTTQKEFYGGNIPFIRSAEINKEKTELFLTEEGLKNSSAKIVNKGDVLIALYGANSGDVAISKIDGAINQAILCIRTEFSNSFIHQFISSKKDWIISKYIQGGQGNLSGEIVKSIELPFPTKPEQQKIASCLSSLDEVITAHSQKLELLKNHKKGLMQNLFPQENEKVPKLRFKEFKGDWEVKTLGKIYSFKITNSFSRDNLNYENGEVKNIHYGDIHKQFRAMFDVTRENVPFINSDLPIKKIAQESYCKEGDIIFADASEDLADIGKSIEIVNLNNEKLVSGLHTLLARPNLEDLSIGFGAYLFQSLRVRKQIQKESQGTKVLSISATRLSNISILFSSKPEQQKIASCLSALDELITAQAEKIEQLKQHKKGLMQGLFPKINEV